MRQRARTDLCGGRSAMTVPTATLGPGSTSEAIPRPTLCASLSGAWSRCGSRSGGALLLDAGWPFPPSFAYNGHAERGYEAICSMRRVDSLF